MAGDHSIDNLLPESIGCGNRFKSSASGGAGRCASSSWLWQVVAGRPRCGTARRARKGGPRTGRTSYAMLRVRLPTTIIPHDHKPYGGRTRAGSTTTCDSRQDIIPLIRNGSNK